MINRIDYKNMGKPSDFEIVDLKQFFATRPHRLLQKDFRLNFWVILYITGGRGVHYVDFTPFDYKKGDLIFIRKNQVHHYEINTEVCGFALHLNEPFFYRIRGEEGDLFFDFIDEALGSPVLSPDPSESGTHGRLVELMYHEYTLRDTSVDIDLLSSLFQSFVLSLKARLPVKEKIFQSKSYENFKTFRSLVEKNYRKTRRVEDYAEMMNLSKKTVNQAARTVAGLSAKQFIINRMILEMKRCLCLGDLLNYEIAEQLGFDEPANMTKFFVRYEGVSPKEFREKMLKD